MVNDELCIENMKKLTVIIVNYNVKFYIDQCLHSLQAALEDIDAEVYVVDNHSRDGSVSYLKKRHPKGLHTKPSLWPILMPSGFSCLRYRCLSLDSVGLSLLISST